MSERWKGIIGYMGLYEFSNLKRIKSLARFDTIGRWRKERILTACKDGKGYHKITLSKNGEPKKRYIHQLVAEYYFGLCPEGLECRHLDGNPENNESENLKYGTRSENQLDSVKHGTHNDPNINKRKMVKCVETNVIYNSTQEAERQTRIAQGSISRVCNGKRKTAGGFHWEYVK